MLVMSIEVTNKRSMKISMRCRLREWKHLCSTSHHFSGIHRGQKRAETKGKLKMSNYGSPDVDDLAIVYLSVVDAGFVNVRCILSAHDDTASCRYF